MAYIPDPTDVTQPTDAVLAETAQAEFRALKVYIAGLIGLPSGAGLLSGFRNRIINGKMEFDQRNGGAALTPATTAANVYTVDRWAAINAVASKLTYQRVADAPAGFKYSLKMTVAAQYAAGAAEYFILNQPIEGVNIIDTQIGTAGAVTLTTSLYIKGSIPGNYPVSIRNSAFNRSYVGTVAVTANWTRVSIAIPLDQAGVWATDNTAGLIVAFDLGSGVNFNAAAGLAWQAANVTRVAGQVAFVNQVNGSTLNIAAVQAEIGAVPTSFEQRPYTTELALCQRYYQKTFPIDTAPVQNVGNGFGSLASWQSGAAGTNILFFGLLPVWMRATPTLVTYSPFNASAQPWCLDTAAVCGGAATYGTATNQVSVSATASAGSVATNRNVLHVTLDADL